MALQVVVQLGLPELTEPDLALRAVQQAAARYDGRLLLAVLDHVVSFPPVVLPVEAMVQACKQVGMCLTALGGAARTYWNPAHKWAGSPGMVTRCGYSQSVKSGGALWCWESKGQEEGRWAFMQAGV